MTQVCQALHGLTDLDPAAQAKVSATEVASSTVKVSVLLADGRAAERHVASPSRLLPTLEALMVVPKLPRKAEAAPQGAAEMKVAMLTPDAELSQARPAPEARGETIASSLNTRVGREAAMGDQHFESQAQAAQRPTQKAAASRAATMISNASPGANAERTARTNTSARVDGDRVAGNQRLETQSNAVPGSRKQAELATTSNAVPTLEANAASASTSSARIDGENAAVNQRVKLEANTLPGSPKQPEAAKISNAVPTLEANAASASNSSAHIDGENAAGGQRVNPESTAPLGSQKQPETANIPNAVRSRDVNAASASGGARVNIGTNETTRLDGGLSTGDPVRRPLRRDEATTISDAQPSPLPTLDDARFEIGADIGARIGRDIAIGPQLFGNFHLAAWRLGAAVRWDTGSIMRLANAGDPGGPGDRRDRSQALVAELQAARHFNLWRLGLDLGVSPRLGVLLPTGQLDVRGGVFARFGFRLGTVNFFAVLDTELASPSFSNGAGPPGGPPVFTGGIALGAAWYGL